MKAEDILKEAQMEVAKKWLYEDWADMRITLIGAKNFADLAAMYEEASLLAMSKVAEQSWDEALDELVRGFKGLPVVNKSTYMNNLFPKI